ncbi:unnamed protein product [Urochloa humidicola]
MHQLRGPVQELLKQLAFYRARLARLLDADADKDLGSPSFSLEHFQIEQAEEMMVRWEQDLDRARAAAMAARRRLILAIQHATIFSITDEVHAGEDVHHTILMLAPDLHDRLFGDPFHADPCSETDVYDDKWEVREKRTDVAIQQLMRTLGMEMKPEQFVEFSLTQSRRDLVECEGDVTRQELRLSLMGTIHNLQLALGALQDVEHGLHDHLKHLTLLGNQVRSKDESLPMDVRFYPSYSTMSQKELEQAVAQHHLSSF